MNGENHKSFLEMIGFGKKSEAEATREVSKTEPSEDAPPEDVVLVPADIMPVEPLSVEALHSEEEIKTEVIEGSMRFTVERDEQMEEAIDAPENPLNAGEMPPSDEGLLESSIEEPQGPTEGFNSPSEGDSSSEVAMLSQSLQAHDGLDPVSRATQALVEGSADEVDAPMPTSSGTLQFHYDESKADSEARILLLEGRANARAFHLGRYPFRFGRDPQNEVILDDANVSRFHAEIREEGGSLCIADLGSTNGVKVNGALVTEQILNSKDVVQIGDALFEFVSSGLITETPAAVVEEKSFHPAPQKRSRRKLVLIAASLLAILAGFIWIKNSGVSTNLQHQALEVAASQAQEEVQQLKSLLEAESKKSVSELSDDEVRKAFLSRLEGSGFAALLPDVFKAKLEAVPALIIKLLVEDPSLISKIVAEEASPYAYEMVLRSKVTELVKETRLEEALSLMDYLLLTQGEDEDLRSARNQLAEKMAEFANTKELSKEDEERFFTHIRNHEAALQGHLDKGHLEYAFQYARAVAEKLSELVKNEPATTRVATPEMLRWSEKANMIRKDMMAATKVEEDKKRVVAAGEGLLTGIQKAMDIGEAGKAHEMIEKFIELYPKHPEMSSVLAMKAQNEKILQKDLEITTNRVQEFLDAESYENAWKEVYRFLDLMPQSERVQELKHFVASRTQPRAVQFYNKARVYEYEADDLISAEQFYKKSIEAADPRGELSVKAKRRYAEVRRKSIQ